jgi:hypothetical protein
MFFYSDNSTFKSLGAFFWATARELLPVDKITRCHKPGDHNLNLQRRQNFKSPKRSQIKSPRSEHFKSPRRSKFQSAPA